MRILISSREGVAMGCGLRGGGSSEMAEVAGVFGQRRPGGRGESLGVGGHCFFRVDGFVEVAEGCVGWPRQDVDLARLSHCGAGARVEEGVDGTAAKTRGGLRTGGSRLVVRCVIIAVGSPLD